jgi:hypothetical protein
VSKSQFKEDAAIARLITRKVRIDIDQEEKNTF